MQVYIQSKKINSIVNGQRIKMMHFRFPRSLSTDAYLGSTDLQSFHFHPLYSPYLIPKLHATTNLFSISPVKT
ncbi:Protein of unknown function [Pyronema omphalodes CBS 100304]|uniref:Uncharacterized protein n=1 Tax=Pyronema omphalodes (strain CBS 100304) TaxID=1076935 RepID=U4LKH2_PYROM|nr:Protein of unknown function [Pyronema omphalodes CBS 100304]